MLGGYYKDEVVFNNAKECVVEALKSGENFCILIKQKGMSLDHDFDYSFPLFSSFPPKKREEEKENE